MAVDKQKQYPFSNKNVQQKKPNVPRTEATIHGYIAGSLNGGHNKPIAWARVMAGQTVKQYSLKKLNIQMLTPLNPAFQKLKCTIRTFFVPNKRVWENSEAFEAQNPTDENRPKEEPNLRGMTLPLVGVNSESQGEKGRIAGIVPFTQCEQYRDMFIASYIPRLGRNELKEEPSMQEDSIKFPAISALPLRGVVAIYNDFLRNKEYTDERKEYHGDTVSSAEMGNYLPVNDSGKTLDKSKWLVEDPVGTGADYYQLRAKKDNSYYTDYRTDAQGFQSITPTSDLNTLVNWADWEAQIAEARSQAENAQLNEWEIIRKIRGSKLLTEGKVQLIGQKTFNINTNAVTQTTYNANDNITAKYQALGQQGAYSYTLVDVPCFAGYEFNESGFIHVFMTVSADTVYSTGIDRQLLNIKWEDQYRPDMKGQKLDVLMKGEQGTTFALVQMMDTQAEVEMPIGYKRKWSEYFKLPNCINGDMTKGDWLNNDGNREASGDISDMYADPLPRYGIGLLEGKTITNSTYTYFEDAANTDYRIASANNDASNWAGKQIFYDYTDLEINECQAVKNYLTSGGLNTSDTAFDIYVNGPNQIFYVGIAEMDTILPIDWEIEENATNWGEH